MLCRGRHDDKWRVGGTASRRGSNRKAVREFSDQIPSREHRISRLLHRADRKNVKTPTPGDELKNSFIICFEKRMENRSVRPRTSFAELTKEDRLCLPFRCQPPLDTNFKQSSTGKRNTHLALDDGRLAHDAKRRAYYRDWNVRSRRDARNGVLYAIGHHPWSRRT